MMLPKKISSKIISSEEVNVLLTDKFRLQKKIVFTNGCFDLLHLGHIQILSKAKELGDILIVGLNSDASVKKLKGKNRPVNNEDSRAVLLAVMELVDYVILFEEDTPARLIEQIIPDILVKGGDYIAEEVVGYDTVTSHGGKVVIVPLLDGFSSTAIINQLG